jgi:hypothetical protein
MKKTSLLSSLFLSLFVAQIASADTIALWTFETPASTNNIIGAGFTVGSTQSGVSADVGSGVANAFHANAATVWSIPAGNGSAHSWSATAWSQNDYFQFNTSTLGYSAVTVSFDMTRSGTGPGGNPAANPNFELFADVGAGFVAVGSFNVLTNGGASGLPAWNSATGNAGYSFSFNPGGLWDNSTTANFEIQDLAATGSTAGTARIDNFLVAGTPVPEPSVAALAVFGLASLGLINRRRK